MGNKSVTTPISSYDQAVQHFSSPDLVFIKQKFKRISNGADVIHPKAFYRIAQVTNYHYYRKYILPRLLTVVDTKKNGVIDFEEYLCAINFFRSHPVEDHIKLLFIMYDGAKTNGYGLYKDNIRQIMVDAMIATQREEIPLPHLENWTMSLLPLSEGMVETALVQFGHNHQVSKLDLQEFIAYVKVEGSVQSYLNLLPKLLGDTNSNSNSSEQNQGSSTSSSGQLQQASLPVVTAKAMT